MKIEQPNSDNSNRMERRSATAEEGGAAECGTLLTYCKGVLPSNRYFGSVEEYLRLMCAGVTVSFLVGLGALEQEAKDVFKSVGDQGISSSSGG